MRRAFSFVRIGTSQSRNMIAQQRLGNGYVDTNRSASSVQPVLPNLPIVRVTVVSRSIRPRSPVKIAPQPSKNHHPVPRSGSFHERTLNVVRSNRLPERSAD